MKLTTLFSAALLAITATQAIPTREEQIALAAQQRAALLQEIRQGTQLNHVQMQPSQAQAQISNVMRNDEDLRAAIQAAMTRRFASLREGPSFDDESSDGDDWN